MNHRAFLDGNQSLLDSADAIFNASEAKFDAFDTKSGVESARIYLADVVFDVIESFVELFDEDV
jgi:hypothetical protein